MFMENYVSNSNKKTEETTPKVQETRTIQKAANGRIKKKSSLAKAAGSFLQDDIDSVKDYIINDVLKPAIKRTISEMVRNGIDMLLYGEVKHDGKRSSSISYRDYYDRDRDHRDRRDEPRSKSVFEYDDIIYDTRSEAETVLELMTELIEKYRVASVSDLYEFSKLTGPYTGNRYGWTDISDARIIHSRDGYMIRFPKAKALD